MKSFHDYHLTGYEVDGQAREIRIDLAWLYPDDPNPRPSEKVIFQGVEDYYLENDLGINIVYAIEEVSLFAHLKAHAQQFQDGAKWGWPRFWQGEVNKTMEHLTARGAKCFEVSSSYGLSGWVVASNVGAIAGAA